MLSILPQPECFTLALYAIVTGNRGPPRDFPRACSSCRSRSPGPLPPWRSVFAWFAPGAAALGTALPPWRPRQRRARAGQPPFPRHPLRRAFFIAYLCGVLWYVGQLLLDSRHHDALRRYATAGAGTADVRLQPGARALLRSLRPGRCAGAPRHRLHAHRARRSRRFCGPRLELAAARITSVPWDQLGYSQVDNALVNQLAPWTGVYGISFVLVA